LGKRRGWSGRCRTVASRSRSISAIIGSVASCADCAGYAPAPVLVHHVRTGDTAIPVLSVIVARQTPVSLLAVVGACYAAVSFLRVAKIGLSICIAGTGGVGCVHRAGPRALVGAYVSMGRVGGRDPVLSEGCYASRFASECGRLRDWAELRRRCLRQGFIAVLEAQFARMLLLLLLLLL
jgi:hypothetical protein